MIDDFENRLSSVQAVRPNTCNGNTSSSLSNSAPTGGVGREENSNSVAPPSYDEVIEQPSLFHQTDYSHQDEDEEEDEDDDENDDTTALLGS